MVRPVPCYLIGNGRNPSTLRFVTTRTQPVALASPLTRRRNSSKALWTCSRLATATGIRRRSSPLMVGFHAEATVRKTGDGLVPRWPSQRSVGHPHSRGYGLPDRCRHGRTIDSVIGSDKDVALECFLTSLPNRWSVTGVLCALNAILVDADGSTGEASLMKRIDRTVN